MGVTGHFTPAKRYCQCVCAFALIIALIFLISCPVSADSQVDSDLVFENIDSPNRHISRRHVPSRRNFHYDVESSQDLEDNEHWASKSLHRIKRQLSSLFNIWGPSTEAPAEKHNEAYGDDTFINEVHGDPFENNRSPLEDDEDITDAGSGEEGSGVIVSPVNYRFTIVAHEPFNELLKDHDSDEFRKLENELIYGIEQLYEDTPGRQIATIISVEPLTGEPFHSKIAIDLSSIDYNNKNVLQEKLLNKITQTHRLGEITVSPKDFLFSQFEEKRVPACGPEEFPCRDGTCVSFNARCDSIYQCPDKSDEIGCEPRTTPTTTTTTTASTTTTTTTTTTPVPPPPPTTTPPPVQTAEVKVQKEDEIPEFGVTEKIVLDSVIPGEHHPITTPSPSGHSLVTSQTGGRVECRADDTFTCHDRELIICADQECDGSVDCRDGSDEANCLGSCAVNEFSCDLRRCLPISQRCDGVRHCDDGTDEFKCPDARCYSDQFTCDDRACIEKYLVCDGRSDCSNGEDERNCGETKCNSDEEFTCGDGKCIPLAGKCNRTYECSDFTDEKNCPECTDDEFKCKNGKCIDKSKKCDDSDDCLDGSDEEDCDADDCDGFKCEDGGCGKRCDKYIDCANGADEDDCGICEEDQFTCTSGDCIDESLRCDRTVDCPYDSSDEENCGCSEDTFYCEEGNCINKDFVCDGFQDCKNNRDELNCSSKACDQSTHFDCGNGICIPNNVVCNKIPDCQNENDESPELCDTQGAKECDSRYQFDCGGGVCIPNSRMCDRVPDCPNGLDESPLVCQSAVTCSTSEYTCADGSCIPQRNICDGTPQCADRSDEAECGCRSDEFLCRNGECIPDYLKCSGNRECSDGSDEQDCPTQAPPTEVVPFECPYGSLACSSQDQCYNRERACDGRFDCNDRSDEQNCQAPTQAPQVPPVLNLKTYPNAQEIKESREVVFQCRDEGPLRASVRWLRENGLPLPPGSRDYSGRLEIPNIQLEHAGMYICQARGFPPSTQGAQVYVRLNVERYIAPTQRPTTACALNEATCANGDCIPKNQVCNGKFDCSDGSDETRCSPHGCEPNEFRCANKRCVLKTWVCDSDDDCGDGSDEIDCGTNLPGAQCSNKQYRCQSGNQCIPRSFHCDGENDCIDRSDEIGCSPVTIVKPPPPMIELAPTSIFEIVCTAVGVPTPEIVWRLNWGHIPEKCKTTSINGTGVLTCPDIQVEDSGAYSCEAINIRGSVFAVPDTILVVTGGPPICPRGSFNDEAQHVSECISCFCFGVTDSCKSADLFTYQLQPPFDAHKVVGINVSPSGNVDTRDTTSVPQTRITPTQSRFGVEVHQPSVDARSTFIPYFVMPENYNSNQLKSYGGYLKYNIRYGGYGRPTSYAPDVILTGNGYTLLHKGQPLQENRVEPITVRFFVGDWIKKGEDGREVEATREEIMMALASVDNIYIKLQYIEGSIDTTLDSVEMDSAAARNTGLGLAVYVEECSCPVGYTGYSCESCAPGYVRHRSGPWLGQCYKEEGCPHGTYGDPSRGIPCRACPCPHTSPPNQFTQTCSLGSDGSAICECPSGYTGNRCEVCEVGFTGNPLVPGDYCKADICDYRGSKQPTRDSYGQCPCKQLTHGPKCDQCKPNSFHLSSDNLFGCIHCFCMGVTKTCRSSDYYRDTITTVFASSKQGFNIVTAENLENPTDQGITLDTSNREIVFNNFTFRSPDVKYWLLPSRFLGDKITSYGGQLKYTVRYTPVPGGSSSRNTAPDVEIISKNHIKLSYYRHPQIEPNSQQTISVPLLEQFWQRNDGLQADREHLLMALADVQAILIKATYTTNSQEVALSSVSLDTAQERNTGNPLRAHEVEHCECPPGYTGLSCQDCDYGYKRSASGLYLGLCEKCECSGYSNECDPETGYCLSCKGYRTGSYCEECIQGYEMNESGQCQLSAPCLCDSRGSISSNCYGGSCRCKSNVEGQTCNRCREGTFGLNANLTEGCQSCFCSGVTTDCSESNLYIEQIPSEIYSDSSKFTLADQFSRSRVTTGFQANNEINEIGYVFRPSQQERLFWSLPRKFTGNRITSYGGRLEFTQRYTQRLHANYVLDQDIIISGNGITIYWTNQKQQQPDIANRISVTLSPLENWQRHDYRQGPRPASREDIMRVLANVDSILIRAQLSSDTESSYISDITLDTVVATYTSNKAVNVEVCRCPPGYHGTSCESCDAGYYRDNNDSQVGPFGSCTRCPCSNRETSCELANGAVLCNCQPGYEGRDCGNIAYTTTTTSAPPPTRPTVTIRVRIEEPLLRIEEVGSIVHFTCHAETSTQNAIEIYWTKDGAQLPNRAVDDHRGLLVITDLRVSDSGSYTCHASDSVNIVTITASLTVGPNRATPEATITPANLDVYEGESFDLRCQVSGIPYPDIHWERENNERFNREHSITGEFLRISKADRSDSGRYICIATNTAGSSTAEAYVRVEAHLPVVEPFIRPASVDAEVGSTFTLYCEVPLDRHDIASTGWEKQDGRLPYYSRTVDSALTITNARAEDSGIYVCVVTLLTGQAGRKTARVTISSYPNGVPPTVNIPNKNQTIGQGSTIDINCEATGSQPLTIKWTRVHEQFGSNTRQIGSTLHIDSVSTDDRGIYVCVANNDHGIAQDSFILNVERRERPEVEIYPESTQTLNEGDNIQVICRIVAGIPEPYSTWSRRDGKPISHHVQQGSDLLRIYGVKREDAGDYICTATNDLGSASATTSIVVNVPPTIILSHTSPLTVKEGDYIRLECRATGYPSPTVQWQKHEYLPLGQRTPDTLSSPIVSNQAILEINSAKTSDEGIYTCQASNSGGRREEYIQVIVDTFPTRGDITERPGEDPGSDGDNSQLDRKEGGHVPVVLEQNFTATVGTRAELRCRVDRYDERNPIQIQWVRQDNISLPQSSQLYRNILYIDNVQPSDAGEYTCMGRDNTGRNRFFVTVNFVVLSPPRITLEPSRQVVPPYGYATIHCRAIGDQPIAIEWHAIGREMPRSVRVSGGYLEFRRIEVSDAGRYRCTARNLAGQTDSVAEVLVEEKPKQPTISAEKRLQTALPGSSVTLRCVVDNSGFRENVHWFREHYPLPVSVQVSGEYLQITNLEPSDAGRYYCEVPDGAGGTVSDYIDLEIKSDNNSPAIPEITVIPTSEDVKYGDNLDLECYSNENGVILTWSKVRDRLADNVASHNSVLRFVSLRTENNGVYRCETKGPSGYYYRDYTVDVIETVQEPTAPPLDIQYAPQGESIYMECKTDLEEPVNYQWSKQNGELAQNTDPHSKQLRINDLTSDDAGSYICSASNGRQSVNNPVVLVVTGIVPYFTQAPNSYLALPTIPDHFSRFNFEISFKPESDYGLILYNGNKRKDFVSLAITGGYIEFKYNLGYDTTTLVSTEPVQQGKWHTVKVRRDRKTGIMFVDGKGPVTVTGKGRYSGLSLTDPLYLGGVPDYNAIPADIDIKSGFVGCISQLKVGHNYYDLLREASDKTGVTTCETCQENPCQNQGVCQESLSREGFTCICTEGFSGSTCNKVASQSCTPYACGVGRCIDNEDNYECHCPLGYVGNHCEHKVSVYEPGFTKDAYVAYPPLKNSKRLRINLKIKPRDLSDGLLLYSAQDPEGHGNFISLAIKDKHIEFRYDVGNGPVIVRSDKEVQVNDYIAIAATKSPTEGKLMIGSDDIKIEKQLGSAPSLTLHTSLYLGGVSKSEITVSPGVGVTSGFSGCISEFNIYGINLNIIENATSSSNVLDCSSLNSENNEISNEINSGTQYSHGTHHSGCSSNPCWNDGKCHPLTSTQYRCSCVNGYTGQYCETAPNQCDQLRPCQNGGTCEGTTTGYRCICPVEYQGTNCEQRQHIGNEVHFEGNGYLEFDRNLLPHNSEDEEIIALQLSTNASNGLVFWQGQRVNEDGNDKDHIALAVVDGYLTFTFKAGFETVDIPNDRIRVDDGKIHTVVLKRRANYGSIEIDNEHLEKGEGKYRRAIEVPGNIYLGGTPNISLMTGRFSQGFVGCIHAFEIQDSHTLELGTKAISGINVKPCSSFDEGEIVN